MVIHSLECLIYLLNRKLNQGEGGEIKSKKSIRIKIRYPNTITIMIKFSVHTNQLTIIRSLILWQSVNLLFPKITEDFRK